MLQPVASLIRPRSFNFCQAFLNLSPDPVNLSKYEEESNVDGVVWAFEHELAVKYGGGKGAPPHVPYLSFDDLFSNVYRRHCEARLYSLMCIIRVDIVY
jgi:hypothetical protein